MNVLINDMGVAKTIMNHRPIVPKRHCMKNELSLWVGKVTRVVEENHSTLPPIVSRPHVSLHTGTAITRPVAILNM